MTTTVHAYSSYVMDGTKLQAVLRHSDGTEQIVGDDIHGHVVVTHHVTDTCELVFREIKRVAPTIEELEAILQQSDGPQVRINPDGSLSA